MKQVGQEGYTYLGIIELDKIKETEMKEKITKEYKRRQRLILKSKLNGRNKVINGNGDQHVGSSNIQIWGRNNPMES